MADPKRLSVPANPARALRDLSRDQRAAPRPDAPEEEDENYTTKLQSDKPTDNTTDKQTDQHTNQQTVKPTSRPTNTQTDQHTDRQTAPRVTARAAESAPPEPEEVPRRADGRTTRVRQNTADRTMVTSLRLAVGTVEALDEFCWRNRRRKQDVIQAALDMYFASEEEEGR